MALFLNSSAAWRASITTSAWVKAVGWRQRTCPGGEGQPFDPSVGLELGDRQHALIEHVGIALDFFRTHETVNELEIRIIP